MTNPVLEAKITDIHSWWEVPCIAHFCSLFRASFNLIDFDIEDLEEALLTDDASDSGSTLIQELIVRLLRGYYGNNSISTFNYQMFLRRLFRQKCREFQCYNPFDNDMDFQFLPMRTKVEILHMLCDFRLDADDVLDILKDLDSDSLRVHPLGYDANKSAYWYFYGTRLYREDYPKKKKGEEGSKKKRKGKKSKNREESDDEVELGSGTWQVVCFTESDWERLALNTEDATDKNEQTLHQIIEEDFLPEIPKLFQEKERLQRKRFLELHPRKSSRLENLKRRKEDETPDDCKRAFSCDATESDDSQYNAEQAKNARYERWKNRNIQKEVVYDSDNLNSDSESLQDSSQYFNQKNSFIVGRGRQTNNSLSSATGEILIESTERSRSPEWFDPKLEDLHIGMYKVLNKLKDHEDSWPFLQPVNEDDAPNYYKVVKSPMSLQKMEDKLDSGQYKSLLEFKHDFHLILANCKQYNGSQNEYTLMGENLEKVFDISVHRYIILNNSSEGEEGTETNDFHELSSSLKKKKRRKLRRISSKNTVEADKENERKISSADLVVSTEVAAHTVDVSLNMDSRILEHKPAKRGKGRPPKNASTFDAFDIVAEQTLRDINKLLDDTPKYSDFCSASNSPSLLSPPKLTETSPEEFPSEAITEPSPPEICVPKTTSTVSTNPVRSYKHKDPSKKRSVKENHHKHLQIIKQSRRDPQRTIDRLQPGKSKGNLISTISKTQPSSRTTIIEEFSTSAKTKESTVAKTASTSAENSQHRVKPMLSLGSVLSHDVINLDAKSKKHTFSDNDSVPSEEEDSFSDNDETSSAINTENNELQAENLALDKPCAESLYSTINDERRSEDKPSTDVPLKAENSNESAKLSSAFVEKSDKPTPNLSAWFKAFGAPKTPSVVKRKTESNIAGIYHEQSATPSPTNETKDDFRSSSQIKSVAATNALSVDDDRYDLNELPPPTPGRFFTYDEDSHSRPIPSLPSPDMKPLKRQRKLSNGSSVSERSSFSQDPNDPLNSPHPSLDESVYQSPQPYHQSPNHGISGALKVGFYQDTFPKGGSDKSNSCSPREPVNGCSPQHPMFSPRDAIASPHGRRDIITSSPHGSDAVSSPRDQGYGLQIASPRNAVTSPRYASGSPRESFAESSPSSSATATCTKSPPVYSPSPAANPEAQSPRMSTNNEVEPPETSFRAYTAAATTPAAVEKMPFSIYPVKKRISAELEHTSRLQDDSPVTSNMVEKQVYDDYPPALSQHMLPPNPFSSAESGSKVSSSSVPISLAHHPAHSHHPHFMNSYSENLLLSANPYFCKDMYVPGQAVGAPPPVSISQSAPRISPLFMQQTDTSAGIYSTTSERNQPHYTSSRQTPSLMGARSYDRNGSGSGGAPLDFTTVSTSSSASTAPLSLTSKAASDAYNPQFHHSRFHSAPHSEGNVLNFSSKNLAQSSIYANQHVTNETANRTAQSPLMHYHQPPSIPAPPDPNNGNGGINSGVGMHHSAENMYRAGGSVLENKLGCTPAIGNYRGGAPYHNVPNSEYFNDAKMSSSYRSSDLRYPNYPLTDGEKQYYSLTQPKNGVVDAHNAAEVANFNNHRLAPNCAPVSSSANTRYDISSYHSHRGSGILPPPVASATTDLPSSVMNATAASSVAATPKSSRKSKKKKATSAVAASNSVESAEQSALASASMYSHFLGGNQTPSSVAAAAAAAAASQEFQHNGLITSGAFNFGTSPSVVQKEYHQYFDNLRNPRYFSGGGTSVSEIPSNSPVSETKTASSAVNHPSSSSASSTSFQFLTQRSTPPFSLAAQAFINANATPSPCGPPPPSIYSSPYLQRTPDELLRPMILPQGLMSAHTGAYPPPHPPPHGYINIHDPISRSPWL